MGRGWGGAGVPLAEGGSWRAAACYRGRADPDPVRVSGGGTAPGLQAKALESPDLGVGFHHPGEPADDGGPASYWSASKPMRFLLPTLDSFDPDPVRKITSGPSVRWLTGRMTISPSERKPTRPTWAESRSLVSQRTAVF